MKKYIVEQFVVIDKAVSNDREFQNYVMDRRTLAEYKQFVHQYDVERTATLLLNNRAMLTKWTFDNKEHAEHFVKIKESSWRERISSQSKVVYSYGPLQVQEIEYAEPEFI